MNTREEAIHLVFIRPSADRHAAVNKTARAALTEATAQQGRETPVSKGPGLFPYRLPSKCSKGELEGALRVCIKETCALECRLPVDITMSALRAEGGRN